MYWNIFIRIKKYSNTSQVWVYITHTHVRILKVERVYIYIYVFRKYFKILPTLGANGANAFGTRRRDDVKFTRFDISSAINITLLCVRIYIYIRVCVQRLSRVLWFTLFRNIHLADIAFAWIARNVCLHIRVLNVWIPNIMRRWYHACDIIYIVRKNEYNSIYTCKRKKKNHQLHVIIYNVRTPMVMMRIMFIFVITTPVQTRLLMFTHSTRWTRHENARFDENRRNRMFLYPLFC